jgi:fatty-acyl-CoA synthase
VFPTGGTTGTPKGAYYDQRRMWVWLNSVIQADGNERGDVELFFSPFFHVTLGVGLLARLLGAGTVRIQPQFDPGAALAAIGEGATRLVGAPTMYAAMRAHPDFAATPRDHVRVVTFGSSPATEAFVRQMAEDYPAAKVRTAFGATEIGPVTGFEHEDLLAGRYAGVGRPLPGVRIHVAGPDGERLGPGEVGELVVVSPWQTLGYYNAPEETAATFRPDGVHLGDLGYFDEDGWLHIAGRSKEMIVTGGENVFPAEVDTVLAEHPGVLQALTYGVPDDFWGEAVEAAIVPAPGAAGVTVDELRDFGRARLAGYKLPRSLRIVDALPLTPNNKPDRGAARQAAIAERDRA